MSQVARVKGMLLVILLLLLFEDSEIYVPEGTTLLSISLGEGYIQDYGEEIRFGEFGDAAPVGPLYVRLTDSEVTVTYEGSQTPHFIYTLAEPRTDLGVSYAWNDLLIER